MVGVNGFKTEKYGYGLRLRDMLYDRCFQDIGNVFESPSVGNIHLGDIDVGSWQRSVHSRGMGVNSADIELWRKKRSSRSDLSLRELETIASTLWQRGLKKKLKKLKKSGKKAGNKVVDAVEDELLGDKDCMDKCNSCDPFQKDTTYLINEERNVNGLYTVITFILFGIFMGQANVCGADLLQRNASVSAAVEKITWIGNSLSDNIVILTEVGGTFDTTEMEWTDTYVTTKFPNGERRYKYGPVYMTFYPDETAKLCGIEYWTKYDEND